MVAVILKLLIRGHVHCEDLRVIHSDHENRLQAFVVFLRVNCETLPILLGTGRASLQASEFVYLRPAAPWGLVICFS